jgi:radical SAM superfamily enzyme YgiQ (UPF0313 family)
MKTKKFLFYGVDLTHNDIALASGTFPLGLAYVASAVKKKFGERIDIKLFKYAKDLEEHLGRETPDFYFFSNYVWNQNLNLSFADAARKTSKSTLIVCGGPNLTRVREGRENFLVENPAIDFVVDSEGEIPSCYMIKTYLDLEGDIAKMKTCRIPSTLTLLENGEFVEGPLAPRLGMFKDPSVITCSGHPIPPDFFSDLQNFDDLPSPYLMGLMDKFFDNQLYPLIETNRGCPFSCSFCQQGTDYFKKITFRRLESCVEEFKYISEKMVQQSPGISRIEIADPNFAMYPQDLEFCKAIREVQDEKQWPQFIGCSTGKNQPERIMNAVSELVPDSLIISNSMQSANPETLEAIKRKNIPLEGYKKVQKEIHERGLRSMADIILCLPKETKESHFNAIMNLIDSGVQEFTSYQAMVLKNSDLEREDFQSLYGMKTKWRVLPRAIGEYEIGGIDRIIPEIEEITVETNTLSFQDYLDSRCLHLTTMIYHNSGVFDIIHRYLKENEIPVSSFIFRLYKKMGVAQNPLKPVYEGFIKETRNELFDSEQEALDFYSNPNNLRQVRLSEIGGNLLFKHLAMTFFSYWPQAVQLCVDTIEELMTIGEDESAELTRYLLARIANVSDGEIKRDISIKIRSRKLARCLTGSEASNGETSVIMTLGDHKLKTLSHAKTLYPDDPTGWSLILSVHRVHTVTREVQEAAP